MHKLLERMSAQSIQSGVTSAQGVEYDELSEAAGTALTRAATMFDPSRGGRLSTYAWPTIQNRLSKLVDTQSHVVRLPAKSRQRMRQLNETYHALKHALGRPPSIEEVAAEVCHSKWSPITCCLSQEPFPI